MTCRICSNSSGNASYEAREMMFGFRDRFAYFQCCCCGCLQIRDFPENIGKYYPPNYYSFSRPHEASTSQAGGARGMARAIRDRYAILGRGIVGRLLYACWPNAELRRSTAGRFPGQGVRVVGLTRRSRILDVGSGSGGLLVQLQAVGFSSLLGIDAFLDAEVEYPGGLRILKRKIHDVTGTWDLIMFHHSFEHMADPQQTLRAAAKLLSPSGTCLIRLPIVSSYAWEHYGVDWVQLDAPRHFFLHSAQSLSHLASNANLEISKIVYDSTSFQFVGSELYRRDIPLRPITAAEVEARAAAFTPAQLDAFEQQAQALNSQGRGDQAAFYLKPRLD